MPISQNRIFGYDLIKTIAIFMIVFYHLGGLDYGTIIPGKYYLPNFNKFLLSICAASVPLFLMVHGALILPKKLSLRESLLKAGKMILLIFFGKVVLQFLILEKCFSIEEKMVHFWFLATLAIVYLASFILNRSKWLRILSLILLTIYPFFSNLVFDIFVFFRPDINLRLLRHDGFFTLYALVYFYLGYYFKDKQIQLSSIILLVFLGLFLINFEVIVMSNHFHLIYDGVNSAFPTIGAFLLAFGLFYFFKELTVSCEGIKNLITFVGSNTLTIYMLHVLVIFLLRKYVLYDSSSFNLLSSILLTLTITFIIAYISKIIKCRFSV